ncbi:hypothetical protein HY750_03630 [Candidatus Kuenenbacteria bacterium]|nr:hypothetical protein [Candidatus Kuenenbacteria bacterium]
MIKQTTKKFALLFLTSFLFIFFPIFSVEAINCCNFKDLKIHLADPECKNDEYTCKEVINQNICSPNPPIGPNSCSNYDFCKVKGCCKKTVAPYVTCVEKIRIDCQDCFFPNQDCKSVNGCKEGIIEEIGCCVNYLPIEGGVKINCVDNKKLLECAGTFKKGLCSNVVGCPQFGETKPKEERKPLDPLNFIPSVTIPGSEFQAGKIMPVSKDNVSDLLARYISAVFEFLVAISAILAVLMIFFAGIKWMLAFGSSEKVGEARKMIGNAILGLVLALATYTILSLINPHLVILKSLNIRGIERIELEYHGQKYTIDGTQCEPLSSGSCSVEELNKTCFNNFGPEIVKQAAGICKIESEGKSIPSGSDICETTNRRVVSFGLFQINISAHEINGLNCPSAFNHPFTAQYKNCYVINGKTELYNQCKSATLNNIININKACEIYKSNHSWRPWGANRICQF